MYIQDLSYSQRSLVSKNNRRHKDKSESASPDVESGFSKELTYKISLTHIATNACLILAFVLEWLIRVVELAEVVSHSSKS